MNLKIVNKQQSIQTCLHLIIVITLGMFFSVSNIIPILALHEEEQLLNNYDDLQEFADAVKDGDEQIEDIPLESMEASDIYEDADESLQDCIDLAAEVGDSLTDKEVVHCVDDVNYFKNKYPTNSSVPITTPTNTTTGTITSTGINDTSTSNGISTAEDEESNLINELVKTGKFTESEAKQFTSKSMQNRTDNSSTSDNTQSSNNQSNNIDQSSNDSTNNPEEYDNFNDLVNDIKNHIVDIEDISLNAFQDSGAYQGADKQIQDCIDLAGKIGDNLGDHEIVNCFEDPSFYKNQISNADNNNNADDTVN